MIESKFLIRKGFKVTAVDNSPDARKYAKNIKKVYFKNVSFQEYDYPKKYFRFNKFSIFTPSLWEKSFNTFIKKIKNSLNPKVFLCTSF